MPTSPSPKRNTKPPPARPRYVLPLILLIAIAVLVVLLIAMPASLLQRFLPPDVHAEDFSGSVWHGSAGRLTVHGRDAGAVEWHLHPASLLSLTLDAEVHWVKVGFHADGGVDVDRHGATLRDVSGGGPIEDLVDLGVPAGWHGSSELKFSELKIAFEDGANAADAYSVRAAIGDVAVSDLASPQIGGGEDLGGYALHLANGAITPDADPSAELSDTGGPLEVKAAIHFSPKEHTGLLSGTVKERAQASAALRSQLDNLTQMHARDAQGRIPVELEFTL